MKLLGAGDNVVDRYQQLRTRFPGGNALNVAVFASRLGARASYMGIVGDDEAGRQVLRSLRLEGVDTSLTRVAHGPNAFADVDLVDNDRVFLRSDRGVALFEPDAEQLEEMRRHDVVHSGYAGLLLPHVAEMAERTKVSFDFGSRYDFDAVKPQLRHLYLASFSAGHLTTDEARGMVQEAVASGANYALATRGAEGAYLASAEQVLHQEADLVTVRDTLGAGDAFIASVLVGLLTHRDRRATLASASAHAAQVCLHHGAFGYGEPFTPAQGAAQSIPTTSPNRR